MDMSMYIYPMDTAEIMKKLRNKVGQLESSMSMNAEKGNVRDPMLETAYQDVEACVTACSKAQNDISDFHCTLRLYADNQKDLDSVSSTLESLLGSKLIIAKPAVCKWSRDSIQRCLWATTTGDCLQSEYPAFSTTFPFVSSELTSTTEFCMG
jgi:conjugal transfer ATP-binding protein TraC